MHKRSGAADPPLRHSSNATTDREAARPIDAEPPQTKGPFAFFRDLSGASFAAGIIAFIFAATGPVAIILAVGAKGKLPEEIISSWIFGSFFLNGLITISYSLYYRQPLAFFWTIPGAVLVGAALDHITFEEAVGAYVASGVLMLVLGASGLVRRVMSAIPMPIVMAMVAGVFLPFGLNMVKGFSVNLVLAASMAAVFAVLSNLPRTGRFLPPLVGAMLVGLGVAVVQGATLPAMGLSEAVVTPVLIMPAFSVQALVELVVPIVITVLVVQNGQGVAVLTTAGHSPPVNSIAVACGIGSLASAAVGAICTCLTGPVNAILAGGGSRATQYTGGVVVGLLALVFGLMAPLFVKLLLAMPEVFIHVLAGLAMLRVLQAAFSTAFKGPVGIGALVSFLVTVSGMAIFNIGAPFWGIVFGYLTSAVLERQDLAGARS